MSDTQADNNWPSLVPRPHGGEGGKVLGYETTTGLTPGPLINKAPPILPLQIMQYMYMYIMYPRYKLRLVPRPSQFFFSECNTESLGRSGDKATRY